MLCKFCIWRSPWLRTFSGDMQYAMSNQCIASVQ